VGISCNPTVPQRNHKKEEGNVEKTLKEKSNHGKQPEIQLQ
jgi:hypothetical protein